MARSSSSSALATMPQAWGVGKDDDGLEVPQDPRTLAIPAALLGVGLPAMYFVTRLEDPLNHEPFWQYQLLGMAFLFTAMVAWTGARRATFALYAVAQLSLAAFGLWCGFRTGFPGTRGALTSVTLVSILAVTNLRVTSTYLAVYVAALMGLMQMVPGVSPRVPLVARVVVGCILVGVAAGIRAWATRSLARSERRFESLLLASPVPTVIVAGDRCQLVNNAARSLLGVQEGDRVAEALGITPPWWVSRQDKGRAPVTLQLPGKRELHCEVAYEPLAGEKDLLQVSVIDRSADRDAMKTSDEVLANVQRQMGPALDAIRGVLAGTAPDSPAHEAVRAAERLQRLLDDMQLVTSLAGTVSQEERRVHRLDDVLMRAARLAEPVLLERGVRLELPERSRVSIRTSLEHAVHAVATLLTQAASSAGRGAVVRVLPEREQGFVLLGVREPGAGEASALAFTVARSLVVRVGGSLSTEPLSDGARIHLLRFPAA